jgi:hypothetical protein
MQMINLIAFAVRSMVLISGYFVLFALQYSLCQELPCILGLVKSLTLTYRKKY